jgi:hypothetical protein
VSDADSLIRERLASAAAFDVVTDPQRVRENVGVVTERWAGRTTR